MHRPYTLKRTRSAVLIASVTAATTACTQRGAESPSNAGQGDFREVVEAAYQRLAGEQIRKKAGFMNECSVDWRTEQGIRVSETVCDAGANAWEVTIRITDPTSRPPSQRQTAVTVALGEDKTVTLVREKEAATANGISLRLDRTGQSVILQGPVRLEPSE